VAVILAEYARFVAWREMRRTVRSQRELASKFGVSLGAINLCIRSKGDDKQPSREKRAATLAARKARQRNW